MEQATQQAVQTTIRFSENGGNSKKIGQKSESCLLHRATARAFSQRIYFGVHVGKNSPANQTVMRHAAHLPSFKNQQMCSCFCRLLIFRELKNGARTEVNSLKIIKGYLSMQ